VASRAYVLFVAERRQGSGPRLGLTVSRKVGNAVVRNRVKRRIREWFRRDLELRGSWDLVVIARREAAELGGDEVAQMLSGLAARALAERALG
jgi:ribonuclease P protein component